MSKVSLNSQFYNDVVSFSEDIQQAIDHSNKKKVALPILRLFNLKEKSGGNRPGIIFRNNIIQEINRCRKNAFDKFAKDNIKKYESFLKLFDGICNCLKIISWWPFSNPQDIDFKHRNNYESVCKSVKIAIDNLPLNTFYRTGGECSLDVYRCIQCLQECSNILDKYGKVENLDVYMSSKTNQIIEDEKLVKIIEAETKIPLWMAVDSMDRFSPQDPPVSDELINNLAKLIADVNETYKEEKIKSNLKKASNNAFSSLMAKNKILSYHDIISCISVWNQSCVPLVKLLDKPKDGRLFSKKLKQRVLSALNQKFSLGQSTELIYK